MERRIAFTGTRVISPEQAAAIGAVVCDLDAAEYITGGALGVDTAVATFAMRHHPEAEHTIITPAPPCGYNSVAVMRMRSKGATVYAAEKGKQIADSYMRRNQEMIDRATELIAFPETGKEQLRSGTWATIRRARATGIPITVWPLDLSPGFEHVY